MPDQSFMVPTNKLFLASLDANGRVTFVTTSMHKPAIMSMPGNILVKVESLPDHSIVSGLSAQRDARKGGDQ